MFQYSSKQEISLKDENDVYEFFKGHYYWLLNYHKKNMNCDKHMQFVVYDINTNNEYTCSISFKEFSTIAEKFEMFKNNNPFMR